MAIEEQDYLSPEEQEHHDQAQHLLDPAEHDQNLFNHFLRRLEEARTMDDEELPSDISDLWIHRDERYIEAVRSFKESHDEAVEAIIKSLIARERVQFVRTEVEGEISAMLMSRNQFKNAESLTTEDFAPGKSPE